MILAGDIGGTKTLIGLFELDAPRPFDTRAPAPFDTRTPAQRGQGRPVPSATRAFPTTDYPGLPAIVDAFFAEHGTRAPIEAAVFGVAGPVIDQSAEMTNITWRVDAAELNRALSCANVRLLNDLEAMAYAVPVLEPRELRSLQAGMRTSDGNIALIAAGTGLGEAVLHRVAGRYVPMASEGGHTDFAARTDRELGFVRFLRDQFGRAEVEHVLSGPGLVNLARFTHGGGACDAIAAGDAADTPAAVSKSALAGTCPSCVEALQMFVAAYGASAGNLALMAVTSGGVFIGGGIAPRILPALEQPAFIDAFNDKGPMRPLLEAMPVNVILNRESGLLGAAVYAAEMIRTKN